LHTLSALRNSEVHRSEANSSEANSSEANSSELNSSAVHGPESCGSASYAPEAHGLLRHCLSTCPQTRCEKADAKGDELMKRDVERVLDDYRR
jgi:hypothetical protein